MARPNPGNYTIISITDDQEFMVVHWLETDQHIRYRIPRNPQGDAEFGPAIDAFLFAMWNKDVKPVVNASPRNNTTIEDIIRNKIVRTVTPPGP